MSDKQIVKRIFDIVSVLILLSAIWPFYLLLIVFVRVFSGKPVSFLQERIGLNGEPFKIMKFRTMVVNAQKQGKGIFVDENDNRVTGIGRILRKFSLDELPQLFNVLKGEMSIVGPRPPLVFYPYKYEEYPGYVKIRFSVKPGLTGYAQVSGRKGLDWADRFVYDIIYAEEQSFWFDCIILLKSIITVFSGSSIYGKE